MRRSGYALALSLAALSFLSVSAFSQSRIMEVKNQRGVKLNTSATQAGTWQVDIATTTQTVDLIEEQRFTITVLGGTGFEVFSATGTLRQCAVLPPSDTAAYRIEVETNDLDGFPILGKGGLVGKVSLVLSRVVLGIHKAIISEATQDGAYKVRCLTQR